MRIGRASGLLVALVACNTGDPEVDTNTTIVGQVIDTETGDPLEGVRVSTMPATEEVATDAGGAFVIAEGPKVAVRYQVTATIDGYESVTKTITTKAIPVGTREENRLDFELTILKICTPGAKRCALGVEEEAVETCGARGNEWTPAACPGDQVCSDGQCVPGQLLTVQTIGAGSGGITSSPGGINCGPSCERAFPQGTTITLAATPFALSGFGGWTGACTGTDLTCMVTMDGDKTVAARFDPTGYLLTVQTSGFGSGRVTSAPAGINCGRGSIGHGTCEYGYMLDEMVTLTAVPVAANNSTFGGWSGACSGTGTCVVTMDQARTVGARFDTQTYPLTVTKAGAGAGLVVSSPAGIDCGATCAMDFVEGDVVTLTATAAPASTFSGWSGACTGAADCVVTMDRAQNVTATFDGVAYPVTVTKMGNGTGRVVSTPSGIDCGGTCTSSFGPGTALTLTAMPDAANAFTGWGGACAAAGVNATCMITVDAAADVSAQFDVGQISVTVAVTGPGAVTSNPAGISCAPTCNASFAGGAQITLTAAPQGTAVFGGWGGACAAAGVNPTCMLTLSGNVTVNAVFEPFYLRPLLADGSCVSLFSFDNPTPLVDECGGAPNAILSGTWAQVTSRATALGNAYQAAMTAGEEGWIDTQKSAPAPGNATFEMTVRKAGAAFNGRTRAVLYSDRDALAPGPGVRLLALDDGSLFFETRSAAGLVTSATAAAALTNGTWAHVAATVSTAAGLRLFVDGVQVAQAAGPIQWTASSSTAWIGAQREGAGGAIYRFFGDIDEVRISNTVRY